MLPPMQVGEKPTGTYPWGESATPYEEAGGEATVKAIADHFYSVIAEDSPVLRAMLPDDTSTSAQKLFEFLSGWMGGPPLFWERHGHPALRMRHSPFPIDDHAASEWTRCMGVALRRVGIEGALLAFLEGELGRTATHLRNHD